MQRFDAIFEIFGKAIFEAIEVKEWSRLNLEAATSKFCNYFWKFGCQPRKRLQISEFTKNQTSSAVHEECLSRAQTQYIRESFSENGQAKMFHISYIEKKL